MYTAEAMLLVESSTLAVIITAVLTATGAGAAWTFETIGGVVSPPLGGAARR